MLLELNDKEFTKTNGIHTKWTHVNERGEENARKIFPSRTKNKFQHIKPKSYDSLYILWS
jgi:hypothetical protein